MIKEIDDSLALHTDLYEINMMYTYWQQGLAQRRAVFEYYFRSLPFGNGYAIFAGLQHLIMYLQHLHFTASDLTYLKNSENYDPAFLDYLRDFHFTCTVRAVPEGSVVFNNEPLIQIEGPIIQGQLIETALLNIVNYQTLIATKAARMRTAAKDDLLLEFGSRRAHELDAALWGTRATYIGGFNATSNVRAGKLFGIPTTGTHAHALVEAYRSDYQAFKAYAQSHYQCIFLIDTYDILHRGLPAAIRVAKEMGNKIQFAGVRIDSGDLAYLAKQVRVALDAAGFTKTKIYASGDLDENIIENLKLQKAPIDAWGVGTRLITAYEQPALGGVYKLVAIADECDHLIDTIKLSNTTAKVTTPAKKQVWRIINHKTGKSEGDYITLWNDDPRHQDAIYMFDPDYTYMNKTVIDFEALPLLRSIYEHGKLVYQQPDLITIRNYRRQQLAVLWDEYKRNLNPQIYPVDFSKELWCRKMNYINHIYHHFEQ